MSPHPKGTVTAQSTPVEGVAEVGGGAALPLGNANELALRAHPRKIALIPAALAP